MIRIISDSAAETERIGERLAAKLNGDEVIALFGGLGMGKTAFTLGYKGKLMGAGSKSAQGQGAYRRFCSTGQGQRPLAVDLENRIFHRGCLIDPFLHGTIFRIDGVAGYVAHMQDRVLDLLVQSKPVGDSVARVLAKGAEVQLGQMPFIGTIAQTVAVGEARLDDLTQLQAVAALVVPGGPRGGAWRRQSQRNPARRSGSRPPGS